MSQRAERSMVRSMCGAQLKDRKRSMDLVFMLGLKEFHRSVGCSKQCLLVWSCVEERGWSRLMKGIRF